MDYLTGMEPIEKLIFHPPGCEDIVSWYNETGGLRRRLELLARLANVLKKLHGKSLVYGDISAKNIFISSSTAHNEVYLIDVDNLCYETNTPQSYIYTPLFGAPEVVLKQHGIDTLSDAHSFAVIAFYVLALGHPLLGDVVIDCDPELEEQALIGKRPWVFHSSDESNYSSHVLPREVVFSKKMFELFKAAFEDGLLDRKKRPGLSAWEEKIEIALQFLLNCPSCKGSYYMDASACPWCHAEKPSYLLATVDVLSLNGHQTLELFKRAVSGCCLQYPGTFVITRRQLGYHDDNADQKILELEIDETLQIFIRSMDGKVYLATHDEWKYEKGIDNQGRKEKIDRTRKSFRLNWRIHLGELQKTHLAIRFNLIRKTP
jgi:serine/threonine protein kinase